MRITITSLLTLLLAVSCIKNDIPYPRIQADFLSIEAEGQSSDAEIDVENRVVKFTFPENYDMRSVKISSYTLTEKATVKNPDLSVPLNLREGDVKATLSLYQDYDWTLTGVQQIERAFEVENQVGTSVIDVPGKRIVAYVPSTDNIKMVKVLRCKIGPEEVSSYVPECEGRYVDFTNPLIVFVEYFGVRDRWTLYVKHTDVDVTTNAVDAWSNVIWAYGSAQAGKDNGFEYRKKSSDQWMRVPEEWVSHDGGSFKARILHVEANTEYEVRAYSGSNYGSVIEAVTGAVLPIPNASFDNWWKNGKVWNPWGEGEESFWDTGNKGATTLGDSNTIPTDETSGGSGKAAMLQTKFVGISVVGKLAAGNIFSGQYVKTDGTNGILSFGREFNARPTRLCGKYKYKTSPIEYSSKEFAYLKGEPDSAFVYVALTDWDQPREIRTNPKNLQLFDPNDPHVIAYGALIKGEDVPDYTDFAIELQYRSTDRIPKYILIVATASKYGDYFTGGASSTLWLDDLTLGWDY